LYLKNPAADRLIKYKKNYPSEMLKNAPKGWKILDCESKVYSNEYIQLYEDLLDINGFKKRYIRGKRKNFSTV
jgi:hypothetical protein